MGAVELVPLRTESSGPADVVPFPRTHCYDPGTFTEPLDDAASLGGDPASSPWGHTPPHSLPWEVQGFVTPVPECLSTCL